jgi:GNAT superfamily N-acetyltransferase
MPDMLVHLLTLPDDSALLSCLRGQGVEIFAPLAPDRTAVTAWVRQNAGQYAADEVDVCFARQPVSCYIAARGRQMLGYACYDAIAPNFFGPTMVHERARGAGIGRALLLKCLWAMRRQGYVYGIIGGVGPAGFYEKCVGAALIPDSTPGVYRHFFAGQMEP